MNRVLIGVALLIIIGVIVSIYATPPQKTTGINPLPVVGPTPNPPVSPNPIINPGPNPFSKLVPPPAFTTDVTVKQLVENASVYNGKTVSVTGITKFDPQYSAMPCEPNFPCDTFVAIDFYLTSPNYPKVLRIYKDKKPFPCKQVGTRFVCAPYMDNQEATITGTFVVTGVQYYLNVE